MRGRTVVWAGVLAVSAVGWLVQAAWAVPAFTRKFDVDCSDCHTIAPALNDFGERFRDRGYSIAGLEASLPDELQDQAAKEDPEDLPPAYWPISLRTILGYRVRSLDHQSTDVGEAKVKTRTSGIDRLDLTWGGLLAKDLNFYITYRPAVANVSLAEPAMFVYPSDTPGGQQGELESAWVRFNSLAGNPLLNLKLGSFELDVPASSSRRLTFSGYPIYGYFPKDSKAALEADTKLNWGEHQLGAELMGAGPSGLRYAVAVINGTNGRADNNSAFDYFARVTHPVSGQRLGVLGYWGTAPTDFQTNGGPTAAIRGSGRADQTFYRLGLDGDLRYTPIRLLFLGVYGSDSAGLFTVSDPQDATFAGGFVEGQYDLLKDWNTILVARFDVIRNNKQGNALTAKKTGDLDGVTLAALYNLVESSRIDLVLHGEYSHVTTKLTSVDGNTQNDNRFVVAFDLMM
ncbi:MAG: hypothetical protein HY207_06820 [Nitrospirae bacterium]|nr:hypothetical protein [Nitrospirota bacterium]